MPVPSASAAAIWAGRGGIDPATGSPLEAAPAQQGTQGACLDCHASGPHGVGYVGTQAAFAFIVALIQGAQPPDSILPGVDRFAGIVGGLAILMVISLVLWPTDQEVAQQNAVSREKG